jgi:hypothetical protein
MLKKILFYVGCSLMVLGAMMACFGWATFSDNPHGENSIIAELSLCSFLYFEQTLIVGVVCLIISKLITKK